MLAYAARGLAREESDTEIRGHLERAEASLEDLSVVLNESTDRIATSEAYRSFVEIIATDAAKAQAAIRLVLARSPISSQLVDNLNASIHLRALLTDLFLIDEVLKPTPSA